MSNNIQISCFQTFVNLLSKFCNFQYLSNEELWDILNFQFTFQGLKLKRIGGGSFREVYKIYNHDYVVKIGSSDANRSEFKVWKHASTKVRRYLGKPVAISNDGRILIMRYLPKKDTGRDNEDKLFRLLPKKFLWDCHCNNIRRTKKGWPKLVDYHSSDIY